MNRIDPKFHENLFRPVKELNSCYSYTAAAVAMAFTQQNIIGNYNVVHALIAASLGMAAFKAIKAMPLLIKQYKLKTNSMKFLPVEKLRKYNMQNKERESGIMIGEGFEWGAEHANRAHQIDDMTTKFEEVKTPVALQLLQALKSSTTEGLGGKPWIHGLGEEELMRCIEETFFGHTFICGNVGTGKTTLLKLLSLGMLHIPLSQNKKTLLIIIDPKNDSAWRSALEKECDHQGLPFNYFNPSRPSESCKIDPLKNYNRITEIADRLSGLLITDQGSNAFIDFGHESIFKVVSAMEYIGERPRITSIRDYLTEKKGDLLHKALTKYYELHKGDGWKRTEWNHMMKTVSSSPNDTELDIMANYYNNVARNEKQEQGVEGMLALYMHNAEHYQKMVTSLLPLFSNLTAEPLDDLLSPRMDLTMKDKRKVLDTKTLSETGGVLYIATGSMSDAKTSSNIAKLLLADITAVAGDVYDHKDGKGLRVSLFVDEASQVISKEGSIINMLAMGRAANYQIFLSTQTIPDLEAKTDSATADRILGLCNNFFSLRVTDSRTQQYVSDQLGQKSITNQQITVNHSQSTEGKASEFGAGYAERLNKIKDASFPPHLLGQLPKLEYMCRLADGKISKGRIPVVL